MQRLLCQLAAHIDIQNLVCAAQHTLTNPDWCAQQHAGGGAYRLAQACCLGMIVSASLAAVHTCSVLQQPTHGIEYQTGCMHACVFIERAELEGLHAQQLVCGSATSASCATWRPAMSPRRAPAGTAEACHAVTRWALKRPGCSVSAYFHSTILTLSVLH